MAIPLPIVRLLNPLVAWLLRSRLHGLLSNETMLITFTGAKTGRTYTTPVSYVRDGDRVRVFTGFRWWRNLRTRPEVTVLVRGTEHRGRAELVTDEPARTGEALRDFLERVPRDKPYFNRGPDGQFDGTSTIEGKAVPVVLIEIRLA